MTDLSWMCVADQVRAMGLQVGDTIEGREHWTVDTWNDARLTLLWVGKEEAMWSVTTRTWRRLEWSEPEESADWTLDCREWKKVSP